MKTRTTTPTKVCKNYLDEMKKKEYDISVYNDKIFGPASQIADICDEIRCLDFKIKDKKLRHEREAALIRKRQALFQQLEELEREEPAVDMASLNEIKNLAEGKSLDNDGLCQLLSSVTKTPWQWFSAFDARTVGSKYLTYGLKFINPRGEIHCFIGSTTDVFKAKTTNTALKNINWFEAITDTEYRDEFKSQPTCLRIPSVLRKAIIGNLALQCTAQNVQNDESAENVRNENQESGKTSSSKERVL